MNHHQKGTQVSHTTRSARTPILWTGLFATRGAPSLRRLALGAPLLALAALLGVVRRPHRARHRAGGSGHTSRTGVLSRANGAAIHPPCVLAPLDPALALAAPVPAEPPPTAVTATAKAKRLKGNSTGVFLPTFQGMTT